MYTNSTMIYGAKTPLGDLLIEETTSKALATAHRPLYVLEHRIITMDEVMDTAPLGDLFIEETASKVLATAHRPLYIPEHRIVTLDEVTNHELLCVTGMDKVEGGIIA